MCSKQQNLRQSHVSHYQACPHIIVSSIPVLISMASGKPVLKSVESEDSKSLGPQITNSGSFLLMKNTYLKFTQMTCKLLLYLSPLGGLQLELP